MTSPFVLHSHIVQAQGLFDEARWHSADHYVDLSITGKFHRPHKGKKT